MSKCFSISGYWKDDRSEFDGLIVKEFDDIDEDEDDDVFYYGLSEENLKGSTEEDSLEFVVTSYEEIHMNQMCKKYPDSVVLPDEDDNCSLCGGDCTEN